MYAVHVFLSDVTLHKLGKTKFVFRADCMIESVYDMIKPYGKCYFEVYRIEDEGNVRIQYGWYNQASLPEFNVCWV